MHLRARPGTMALRNAFSAVGIIFSLCLTACVSGSPPAPAAAAPQDPFADQIHHFVETDRAAPPAPCQLLFVGSSSIVKWSTLATDMTPLPVINRGFGGSQIADVNHWFDQVVAPYHPRAIVFYAGENDIAAGKTPAQVVADFDTFMARKTAELADVPVYFISLKPSKLRFEQLERQSEVNQAIRARSAARPDLHYIDIVPLMLENGQPKDLFVADHLHMSAQGYVLWTEAVRAAVLPDTEAQVRQCQQTLRH